MFTITDTRQKKLRRALVRLAQPSRRWVSLDFFSDAEINVLVDFARAQQFRRAQSEIVHRANRVFQDFDVCFPAPRRGVFDDLAAGLECTLRVATGFTTPATAAGTELSRQSTVASATSSTLARSAAASPEITMEAFRMVPSSSTFCS